MPDDVRPVHAERVEQRARVRHLIRDLRLAVRRVRAARESAAVVVDDPIPIGQRWLVHERRVLVGQQPSVQEQYRLTRSLRLVLELDVVYGDTFHCPLLPRLGSSRWRVWHRDALATSRRRDSRSSDSDADEGRRRRSKHSRVEEYTRRMVRGSFSLVDPVNHALPDPPARELGTRAI